VNSRRVPHTSWRVLAGAASCCALLGACSSDTPAPAGVAGGGTAPGGAAGTSSGGAGTPAGGAAGSASSGMAGTGGSAAGGAGSGGLAGGGAAGASGGGAGGAAGASCEPGPFALTSPEFEEDGPIEEKFRCTGDNVSTALQWSCGPAGTLSYAVTQIHDGSQSLHWLLYDIPASAFVLPEAIARESMPAIPAGSKQVKPNVDGSTWYGYSGPCPGGANQSYTYFIYALDVATLPGITPESTIVEGDAAVKEHQLAVATLTGTASKE
jgi:Raf kinase inhibitor-like YbhB/YbcL family protein